MALSESTKASRLNHKNVVKIYDTLLIEGVCCIAMECCEYGSLFTLISNLKNRKETLTMDTIENMFFQCCEALSLMKQNEIVHSDIKPGNILIKKMAENNFECLLADFGYSIQNCPLILVDRRPGGTRGYMSKEMERDRVATFNSDLFALGVTFKNVLNSTYFVKEEEEKRNYLIELFSRFMSDDPDTRVREFYSFCFRIIKAREKISPVFENDATLMDMILEFYNTQEKYSRHDSEPLLHISGFPIKLGPLLQTSEFLSDKMKRFGKISFVEYLDHNLLKNREILLESIKRGYIQENSNSTSFGWQFNGVAVDYFDMFDDKEIVLTLLSTGRSYCKHISERLRGDREIILASCGSGMEFASDELKNDRELIIECFHLNPHSFVYASLEIKHDKCFILKCMEDNLKIFAHLPKEMRSDRDIVLKAVTIDGFDLTHASQSCLGDREIIKQAIATSDGSCLEFASVELKDDDEIAILSINKHGSLISVSERLRDNKELVLIAVTNNGLNIEDASLRLRGDFDVVMAAVTSNGKNIAYASDEMRINEEIVKTSISTFIGNRTRYDQHYNIKYASPALVENTQFILEAIWVNPNIYGLLNISIRSKKEIVSAYAKHPDCPDFIGVPKEFIQDREFMLEIGKSKNIWHLLYNVCKDVAQDHDFILRLVSNNPDNFHFMKDYFKLPDDFSVICKFIETDARFLACAPEHCKSNKELVLKAIKQNWMVLQLASPLLRDDQEVVQEAMKENLKAWRYASDRLKDILKSEKPEEMKFGDLTFNIDMAEYF